MALERNVASGAIFGDAYSDGICGESTHMTSRDKLRGICRDSSGSRRSEDISGIRYDKIAESG